VSGVIPLTAFMLLQLRLHAKALDGAQAHREALRSAPQGLVWTLFIVLPLALHVGLGAWLALRHGSTRNRYALPWLRTAQRFTALLTLGFFGWAGVVFWWPIAQGTRPSAALFSELTRTLSSTHMGIPWHALIAIIGLAACSFHLANGLHRFARRWGLTRHPLATRIAGPVLVVLGLVTFFHGARTIVFFATGWAIAHERQPARTGACRVAD